MKMTNEMQIDWQFVATSHSKDGIDGTEKTAVEFF